MTPVIINRDESKGALQRRIESSACRRRLVIAAIAVGVAGASPLSAQEPQVVDLTLERAVEMALDDSYQVRRVRLEVERTQKLLEAQRAGLKSRVNLNFELPEYQQISERQYNSVLERYEIVGENSRRWEMGLSITQPVILPILGYPTNGYLSLNNRIYRYTQIEEDERDLTYYNRYFIQYRQPLFQTNNLRNSLENAQLDLQDSELDYQTSAVRILETVSENYEDLFETAYQEVVAAELVANLEQALAAATARAQLDPSRAIDQSQTQVALSNARSELDRIRSDFRLDASRIKPNLGLEPRDSIIIRPTLEITPFTVDLARAIELGMTLRPQMQALAIERRKNEIQFAEVSDRNSFRLDVELSYGREMQDPEFGNLIRDPRNSYTVGVSGSLPIWDWGERDARIEAQRLVLDRHELSIEETREQIEVGITNTVRNLEEYQQRAQSMEANLELAAQISAESLAQYSAGGITILDLLQSFERQEDTAENFLEAYMGYRNAVLSLQRQTYFDFETQVPILERYGIGGVND
jgi:outer membrane protein